MKILKVSFSNLNSLVGSFSIDFTCKAFSDNGIFVISGPTGAGKSTILDAITLALYSKTARLDEVGGENGIMSRQEGQCHASVIFEASGKVYEAYFAQHRSHKKLDGQLQNKRHDLSELDSTMKKGTLIAKGRQTVAAVSKITGLDFNNFTRAVMLCQGNFASFLKASENERAELLEKITGTQLYSQISAFIFGKCRDLEQALALKQRDIDALHLLSKEEIDNLNNEIKECDRQRLYNLDNIKLNEIFLKRSQSYLDLKHKHAKAISDVDEAQNNKDSSSSLYTALASHKTALAFYDSYVALNSAFNSYKDNLYKAALNSCVAQSVYLSYTEHTQNLKKTQDSLDSINTSIKDFNKMLPEISTYDSSLKSLSDSMDKTKESLKTLLSDNERIQTQLGQKQKLKDKATDAIDKAELYITEHKEHDINSDTLTRAVLETDNLKKSLLSDFSPLCKAFYTYKKDLIDSLCQKYTVNSSLETLQHDLVDTDTRIEECNAIKNSFGTSFDNLNKQNLDAVSISYMLKEYKSLIDAKETCDKNLGVLQSKKTQTDGDIKDLDSKLKELLSLIKSTEEAYNTQKRLIELDKKIISLDKMRGQLEPGTPCPLCGSKEHPYASYTSVISNDDLIRLDNLESSLKEYRDNESSYKEERIKLTALLQSTEREIDDHAAKSDTYDKELDVKHGNLVSALDKLQIKDLYSIDYKSSPISSDKADVIEISLTAFIQDNSKILSSMQENDKKLESLRLQRQKQEDKIKSMGQGTAFLDTKLVTLRQKIADCYTDLLSFDNKVSQSLSSLNDLKLIAPVFNDAMVQEIIESEAVFKIDDALDIQKAFELLDNDSDFMAIKDKILAGDESALSDFKVRAVFDRLYSKYESLLLSCADNLQDLKHKSDMYKQKLDLIAKEKVNLNGYQISIDELNRQKDALDGSIAKSKADLLKIENEHKSIKAKRFDLFADNDVNVYSGQLQQRLNEADTAYKTLKAKADASFSDYRNLIAKVKGCHEASVSYLKIYEQSKKSFLESIAPFNLHSLDEYKNTLLDKKILSEYESICSTLDESLNQAKAHLKVIKDELLHYDERYEAIFDPDRLKAKLERLHRVDQNLNQSLGQLHNTLLNHDKLSLEHQALIAEYNKEYEHYKKVARLNRLIGTADGKKYRRFVQSITLEYLINLANKELLDLTDRYVLTLKQDEKSSMSIYVIDLYQFSLCRPVDNLSGGESFLLSLALSLALSSLASLNVSVESLFLDEGFGTLDDETLDLALNALTSLQQRGRLIGVISHVSKLKERIKEQIEVTKLSGGRSTIKGPGCSATLKS
ncbi:AAA family ATPase [Anaerobiospirillum thomasii]|uniref:Nuclease sbcCD subunit C n=1 Tax=Anaerobiospirillum thomasii TaxID=179995 RepID=A0A2X0VRH8_9GAMM|nr:AAA family ATPase [Anaerobiospirillum thomasii]SPT70370.1 Nuclease sbcCD subunit C [Anaerobiospirillum thomasii]